MTVVNIAAASRRPERVICVLGMHRSGTSCLTGSLQERGLILGKYHQKNPFNKKGNRENQDVVDLHEALLINNAGSWDQPPSSAYWGTEHIETACAILARYADASHWGFKDPRSLMFIDGWRALVPDIHFVGTFRHPFKVAASLGHRNAMPEAQAIELWLAYNKRLLALYQELRFPILCFDWEEHRFQSAVSGIAMQLGLDQPPADQPFFTEELRSHESHGDRSLPPEIAPIYEQLLAASES